ncbi:MAG: tetratricopeptide repeat protein [Pirellulaceae bacterium]|nr:tetratricopeptide repeat protein [Pirellulaceae bacterium]
MMRLLRCCYLAALLIPFCTAFAQEQASPVGTKVIVVASDVELSSDEAGIRRAQYGDVATVAKVDGQKLWLQEKGGWIRAEQVIPAEGAMQTWNKLFSDMQDQNDYDADVALKFAAALSAYNQMTAVQQVTSQIIQKDPSVAEAYRLRGLCLALDNKFPAALADFNKAVSLEPKSADLRINRAICQVGVGQFDAAIKQLTEVLADEVDHVEALYRRATVYRLQEQHDAALRDYARVLKLSPQHIKALRERAELLCSRGDFDLAIADAESWIEADPEDSRSYVLLGDIYRDAEDAENAVKAYSRALDVDPNRLTAFSGRGSALLMMDQRDEAVEDFQRALELYPQHVPALLELGRILVEDGEDLQTALGYFQQACEEDPQNVDAHAKIGDIFLAHDQLDQAVNSYSEALNIAPDSAWILTNRGVAYEFMSQLPEAIADYSRAIELEPTAIDARRNRAGVYTQQAEYDKAIADYSEGIALDPEFADLYIGRAGAYTGLGDIASLKAAVADCDKSIALEPDSFYAFSARGYASQQLGALDAAIADFRKAIDLDGPAGEAHRLLGYVLYLKGDMDAALAELTQAIALNYENAESYRLRGIVHSHNGSYDLSWQDLETALVLAPDDVDTLVELANTYDEMWKHDDALAAAQRAIQLSPENVWALNYRAYLLGCGPEHLRQPEQALEDALLANRLADGADAAVLDTLACAYAATGDFERAIATGNLAIAKAEGDEGIRKNVNEHLELFKQKQVFLLPEDRPIDLETGPSVDGVAAIEGAVDTTFVPADCFAALHLRPADILALPHLSSFPKETSIQPLLSEFGTNAGLVEEVLVPMFPSRDLPPAFLLRFNRPVGPDRVAEHPSLDVTGWKPCEYSGRECFGKLGRVTCFVDDHTVITGPRAAVKRMLAADGTPSRLRNALGQKERTAAFLVQIEFSVCPEFIAAVAKQQAEKSETAAFAQFMPEARSFSASLTSAEHLVLKGTAEMNDAVVASRLNLSLNEALQDLQSSMTTMGYDAVPLEPAAISELKTIVNGLLANATLSVSGSSAKLEVSTTNAIEAALQKLGKQLASVSK